MLGLTTGGNTMRLTDIDIKDTIYQLLRTDGIHEEVSGRIYKDMRPAN